MLALRAKAPSLFISASPATEIVTLLIYAVESVELNPLQGCAFSISRLHQTFLAYFMRSLAIHDTLGEGWIQDSAALAPDLALPIEFHIR
jgi:hypothetical protein